jgi:hypothetical protein
MLLPILDFEKPIIKPIIKTIIYFISHICWRMAADSQRAGLWK